MPLSCAAGGYELLRRQAELDRKTNIQELPGSLGGLSDEEIVNTFNDLIERLRQSRNPQFEGYCQCDLVERLTANSGLVYWDHAAFLSDKLCRLNQ